jgi:hypothetical protein
MQIERIESEDCIEYGYYKGDEFIWHREDGPAVEYADGDRYWYINGKRHREGGPAVESASGYKAWYLEDKYIEEEDFEEALKIYKVSKVCK